MTQTTARIKQNGKHFEIIVDLGKALKFKRGESSNVDFLEIDKIFTDSKKGFAAPEKDITESFGTLDVNSVFEDKNAICIGSVSRQCNKN